MSSASPTCVPGARVEGQQRRESTILTSRAEMLLEKVLGEAAVRRLGPQVVRSWRLHRGGDGRIGDGTQQVGSLEVLHGV